MPAADVRVRRFGTSRRAAWSWPWNIPSFMWGYTWRTSVCGIVDFLTWVASAGSQTVVADPFQARVGALDQVALEFRAAGVTAHATRATNVHREGDAYSATLATDDPVGRTIAV